MDIRFPVTIDITPELLQPLATAIGGVVIGWGSVEATLNLSVAMVFQMAGGHHHAEQGQIPFALKRKLKFMRLCLSSFAPIGASCFSHPG